MLVGIIIIIVAFFIIRAVVRRSAHSLAATGAMGAECQADELVQRSYPADVRKTWGPTEAADIYGKATKQCGGTYRQAANMAESARRDAKSRGRVDDPKTAVDAFDDFFTN